MTSQTAARTMKLTVQNF